MRILILHDQRLFREGLRAILLVHEDLEVIADAAAPGGAAALIFAATPDVVVVDLCAIGQIARTPPLVALGEDGDRAQVARALQTGVFALASKSDSPDEVLAAIRAAAAGEVYVTPRLRPAGTGSRQPGDAPDDPLSGLTGREREIFTLVVGGLSTSAIARRLDISPRTVETHRAHLSRKLNAHSASDLVRFAARHQLLLS
jgi:two-component system response regulator NreC